MADGVAETDESSCCGSAGQPPSLLAWSRTSASRSCKTIRGALRYIREQRRLRFGFPGRRLNMYIAPASSQTIPWFVTITITGRPRRRMLAHLVRDHLSAAPRPEGRREPPTRAVRGRRAQNVRGRPSGGHHRAVLGAHPSEDQFPRICTVGQCTWIRGNFSGDQVPLDDADAIFVRTACRRSTPRRLQLGSTLRRRRAHEIGDKALRSRLGRRAAAAVATSSCASAGRGMGVVAATEFAPTPMAARRRRQPGRGRRRFGARGAPLLCGSPMRTRRGLEKTRC